MKTCLLCGTIAADNIATCAKDGEATWTRSVTADATPIDVVAEVDATPVDSPKPRTSRSKR